LAGCSRQGARPAFERVAILRFENLGPDRSTDWMGRAFSEVISADLAAAPDLYAIPSSRLHNIDRSLGARPVTAPGISTERTAALALGATLMGYGDYFVRQGTVHARLTLQDPRTQKTVKVLETQAPAGEVAQAAGRLAHDISPHAGDYGTANAAALNDYITALELPNAAAAPLAQKAIASDPGFGPAYLMLASAKLQQQDRAGALAVLDGAHAKSPIEAARIELERSTLRGDNAGRLRALEAAVKAAPGDPETWRSLGELSYALRQYPRTVTAYQKVLAIEPNDVNVMNQLGYAAAYAGNLELALATLRKYAELQPKNSNPVDSTGDVELIAGRIDDATKSYLAAYQKDATFLGGADLMKAAVSRLMAGDIAHANELAKQFVDARSAAHDATAPQSAAEWLWITGRHQDAYAELASFAKANESGPGRELASRAYSELGMWSLLSGDRDAANQLVQKAGALSGPNSAGNAILVRFLAQPTAAPPEWKQRAAQLFRNPAQQVLRDEMTAYALMLDKQYAPAGELLRAVYENNGTGAGEGINVLLGWCYAETGRAPEAGQLLGQAVIPPSAIGELVPVYFPMYFPRVYQLRAQVEDRQGDHSSADKNRALYRAIAGGK